VSSEDTVTVRIYHTCEDEFEVEVCKACAIAAAYAKWLEEQEDEQN
jgi:NMD protein affecting ribosome stability and mRNA decay